MTVIALTNAGFRFPRPASEARGENYPNQVCALNP